MAMQPFHACRCGSNFPSGLYFERTNFFRLSRDRSSARRRSRDHEEAVQDRRTGRRRTTGYRPGLPATGHTTGAHCNRKLLEKKCNLDGLAAIEIFFH